MKKNRLYIVGFCLFLAAPLAAQVPRRTSATVPPPTHAPRPDVTLRQGGRGTAGSFQTPDGHWHPVQVDGWLRDRVYLNERGGTLYKAFGPEEVRRFVVGRDTVCAAYGPGFGPNGLPYVYGLQLFRGAGFQLLDVSSQEWSVLDRLGRRPRLLLRRGTDAWQKLPKNRLEFNHQLLAQLSADPEFGADLRAGRTYPRRQAAQLLQRYADWAVREQLRSFAAPSP